MKKLILLSLLCSLVVVSTACGGGNKNAAEASGNNKEQTDSEEKTEVIVFAAASMTETIEEIAKNYEEENPKVKIIPTFDSSGTLKTQIEEGADCDLFISASQKHMNNLDIKSDKNEDKLDFIDSDTRVDLLENKVTVAVKPDSDLTLESFKDLASDKVKSIGLGNSDVPVGKYSEEILKNIGVWDEIQDKITFGSNVKEVTNWISESAVDCGIIYQTDAFSANLKVLITAGKDELNTPVVYPAAVTKNSKNKEEAKKFLEYLQNEKSSEIFESVGFNTKI
ncbi:molybdate ABC transporter substrate-binding protein [Peptoniphilus catoniae]|uniref:molybdate ABC transporter substrate-binding protein n=1 Tax=Peptoniphilus catoniae TaxID=1660341 RepID=UPI0010FF15ED|nr:molybdate ABC transporter substrate-binding protein [Peptoniphilus catoniae]